MTIRSLGYLKLLVETMLVSVDYPKHRVLCCSASTNRCCSLRTINDEDFLGLAYSKQDMQSVLSLDLQADLNATKSYQKLKLYRPSVVTVDSTWRKEKTMKVVGALCRQLHQVGGGAEECSDDKPMMFLPGKVLHLEDSPNYDVRW